MSGKHELWSDSLLNRLSWLTPDTHRIAYVAAKPDMGTFRYRAFNPVNALRGTDETLSASYFFLSDLDRIDNLSLYADTLVAVRLPYDDRVDRLFRTFSRQGKKVLFDIDDLVVDVAFDSTVAANLGYELRGESLYWWTAFVANWGKSLSLADEIITTTANLKQAISRITAKPIHIIPNTFNRFQLEASPASPESTDRGTGLHIGYFSGSKSHEHDFRVALPALIDYLSSSPGSRLTIGGHLEGGRELERFGSRVTRLPFMDFRDLQRAVSGVDLNIAPLQNSPFTAAKSELKYFEAALSWTPTLASTHSVFDDVITPGTTGFLSSATGWGESLRDIEAIGAKKREAVARQAREHSLSAYSPDTLRAHMKSVFG